MIAAPRPRRRRSPAPPSGAAVVLADEPVPPRPAVPVVATATPAPTAAPARANASAERIVARAADPDGGRPWAIRRYRLTEPRPTNCVEVGRLDGERFGWVDAGGSFAPVRAGSFRLFGACASAKQLRKLGTSMGTFTTLSMPPGGALKPRVTVTWAMALRSVRAVVPDGERRARAQRQRGRPRGPARRGRRSAAAPATSNTATARARRSTASPHHPGPAARRRSPGPGSSPPACPTPPAASRGA